MNFIDATTSKSNKPWIDDEQIRIVFEDDESHNIISVKCTLKEKNVTKTFKPRGKDQYALVRMFQDMEKFIGKIKPTQYERVHKQQRKKLSPNTRGRRNATRNKKRKR